MHRVSDAVRNRPLVAQNGSLGDAAHKLVALALEKDGGDNTSVQLIRIKSVKRMRMCRGRP
jgi:serine/threonine protein phosphatase PrpC